MPSPRQTSFATGEVSPEFYGATDNPRYNASLRTCKNFLPVRHGALVNRPGTKLDAHSKNDQATKLQSFVFSDLQTMVLEFGSQTVRFHTSGGLVVDGGGVTYELATPYALADVFRLKFSQSGDVITITCRGYAPQDLVRLANANWTIGASSVGPPAGFVVTGLVAAPNGHGGDNGTGWSNAKLYQSGDYAYDGAAATPASYIAIASSTNKQPSANLAWWALSIDSTHTAREWDFVVTVRYKDALGRKLEGLPCAPLKLIPVARGTDRPITMQWAVPANPGFSYAILGFSVYAGRSGLYGWIGDADPATLSAGVYTFKDEGAAPNFAVQPPKGTDPFLVADGNNTAATHSYPAAVAYHELRRVYGGTASKPNHILGSKQDDYTNYDLNFPVQDTDSYDFGLAAMRLADVRWLLSLNRLLVGTGEAVFAAEGQQGSTIKPTSVQIRREQGEHGCSSLQGLAVGNTGIYVTAKGNYVRDAFFNWQVNGLDGNDLTDDARHLFDGRTIVDWCYAGTPYKVVWAVRDDGLLLSMTYDRTRQVWGWAQHPMSGHVKSVCSVPEGTEDAVYMVVQRTNGTFVERMASRLITDVRTACFLDCALTFDGRNTGASTVRVSGASFNAGDTVTLDTTGNVFVGASDLNDQVVICPDGIPAVLDEEGEVVTAAVPPTRVTITQFNSATQALGQLEAPLPAVFQNEYTANWGWARDAMTGLAHLEGQTVYGLVDGVVQGPFVVVAGQVALAPPGLIATVGLQYDSDAELMDLAPSEIRANVKSVERVVFEVVGSRGIYAGQQFDTNLAPAKLRSVTDSFGYPALVTGQVPVPIRGSWNTGARAVVRQSDPLPLTIVAAVREVDVGGKGT